MFNKLLSNLKSFFHKDKLIQTEEVISNSATKFRQVKVLIAILVLAIIGLGAGVQVMQKKSQGKAALAKPVELKHELADKALDPDKGWRNHFEDELKKISKNLDEKLDQVIKGAEEEKKVLKEDMEAEISRLKEQLKMARQELADGAGALQKVAIKEEERLMATPTHTGATLEIQEFDDAIEYDTPKSASEYIPSGTYFTGYLRDGIVVSTALNAPEERPVPVTIKLKHRGNLPKANKTDIEKCWIEGSARGDLSSERAEVRLEKLICEENDMIFITEIAGQIYGPDGFNGIKGSVISTGSKHLNNAMLGGFISGISSSAKGQEGVILSSAGAVSTKSQSFKDIAKSGALSGISNAGEKMADHFLRLAESMSPVLTVPAGTRVNPKITEGVFMRQVNTRRIIKAKRENNTKSGTAREKTNSGEIRHGGEGNASW